MIAENFDKYARNTLQGHKSAIDTESLWSAVQVELNPEPKSKRRFIWFWLFGAGLLLSSAVLFYNFSNNNTPNSQSTAIAPIENIEQENITPKSTALNNTTPDESIQLSQTTNTNVSANTKIQSTPNHKPSAIIENFKSTLETKIQASGIPIYVDEKEEENSGLENVKHTLAISSIIDSEDKKNTESIISEPEITPAAVNVQEEISTAIESEETIEIEDPKLSEPPAPAIPPRSSFVRDLSIGFGVRGGISSSLTTLRAFEDNGNELRELRELSESSLETIELGFEALVKHELGFYASTGVEYLRYTRRMDFNQETVTIDSIQGVTRIIVNPITMDTTRDFGMVAVETTTTRLKEIYNLHEFINIPISLGYGFEYDAWTFGVEATGIFNIKTNISGQIMDTENSFYDLERDEKNWFKDNVGVSFRASLLVGYTLADAVQIYAGPSFRSPIRLDESINPVEQEQTGLGFQLGARYWLNN